LEEQFAIFRERVLEAIERQGIGHQPADPQGYKAWARGVHAEARSYLIERNRRWLERNKHIIKSWIADGSELELSSIRPQLITAESGEPATVFRWLRLMHWSLPYSKGYGRRLRYLIVDGQNGKVIGLLGLQSPPIDLKPRDRFLSVPSHRKLDVINHSLDIYVLGAIPPYQNLMGGKLVALLSVSEDIQQAYRDKYTGRLSELAGRPLPDHLTFLTTMSAFGRSSIYNRLTFERRPVAQSLGLTSGSGTFHFPQDLYDLARELLNIRGIDTRTGPRTGSRRKLQIMTRALEAVGLKHLRYHGVLREVFILPLCTNLLSWAREEEAPRLLTPSVHDLSKWWFTRWANVRAGKDDSWKAFCASEWVDQTLASVRLDYVKSRGSGG